MEVVLQKQDEVLRTGGRMDTWLEREVVLVVVAGSVGVAAAWTLAPQTALGTTDTAALPCRWQSLCASIDKEKHTRFSQWKVSKTEGASGAE